MKSESEIKNELLNEVTEFLNDPEQLDTSFDCIPYNLIKEVLNILDYEGNDNFDQNGWQMDYWQTFSNNKDRLDISGSMYYGNLEITKI